MASEANEEAKDTDSDCHKNEDAAPIDVNGTHDLICAPCFNNGDHSGAVGICKECKFYLCSKCVAQHRTVEQSMFHKIAFFYCALKKRVNKLVRANSFCLDCGHYLCDRCKLNHGGFREYRHHTFIGGEASVTESYDQCLLPKRRTLQSRGSRKSGQSIFTQREYGSKSPYVGNNVNVLPEHKKRNVSVEEQKVERSRKLLYSNVGRASQDENPLNFKGTENTEPNHEKRVQYEASPAELVGEYNLKGPDDKRPCKIISSLFVDDDQLVVSDIGNKNIKLYDPEFKCQSTMNIAKFPVALCKVKARESELFASSGNRILLLGTYRNLTLIREIQTDASRIEGLTTWDTGVAIVFKSIKSKHDRKGHLEIRLINYEGETKYVIAISSQHVVKLDTPIWYIAMTNDDQYLLLSDTHNNRIVCISTAQWRVAYVLRGKTSGGAPKSLSLDQDGNLLVSWFGEVRKISPHGRDLGVYVSNISDRTIVSYNEHKHHVALPGCTWVNPNQCKVYQLRV